MAASRKRGGLAAVADRRRPQPPDLCLAVEETIAGLKAEGMHLLTPADTAMIALARQLAFQIEEAADRVVELEELWRDLRNAGEGRDLFVKRLERLEARCELTKLVGWLGPQLQGVLRDLGGAPAARKAMSKTQPAGKRLEQLRAGLPGARPGADAAGQTQR